MVSTIKGRLQAQSLIQGPISSEFISCAFSKLNPCELVGGFDLLAIACINGDADKRIGAVGPQRIPKPAPRCWNRSPCAFKKLRYSSAAELVARAFAFGIGCLDFALALVVSMAREPDHRPARDGLALAPR